MMRDAFGAFRRRIEYIIGRFIAGNVTSSPMFDRDWYLKQNPDIRKTGIDPADHYRRAGWLEGRLPGPDFKPDTRAARWLWRYVGGAAIVTRSSARLDADWQFLQQTRAETVGSRVQTRSRIQLPREADAPEVPLRARPHATEIPAPIETLNIVFINHGPYDNNSALHIAGFADALVSRGHRVVVSATGVPDSTEIGAPQFHSVPHQELSAAPERLSEYFAGGGCPDIVHCWTPRPLVQRIAQAVTTRFNCPYIVHFEDNEAAVARAHASGDFPSDDGFCSANEDVAGSAQFVGGAAGATIIVESLMQLLPPGLPCHLLEPGVDCDLFSLSSVSEQEHLCRSLGLPLDAWITVYPGNIHPANYEDMFSLYVAIHALNSRGFKVHLVRTGIDGVPLIDPRFGELTRRCVTNLGFVDRKRLVDILKVGDFFIQPGGPDDFNRYRLPSKIPELLAIGKPVVLPKTNIGLLMQDRVNALLMERGDAAEITDCVEALLADPDLAGRVGQGGRHFAVEHFNWERSALGLEEFYRRVLGH
jgi:glycosyltransferase involved in cell wall biosynthesis